MNWPRNKQLAMFAQIYTAAFGVIRTKIVHAFWLSYAGENKSS